MLTDISNKDNVMETNKEIKVIEKKLAPVLERAKVLEITSKGDMETAVDILSTLNSFVDKVTAEKERVTKPLLLALKNERSRWSPIEKAYEVAINLVRQKMTVFQTAEVKAQREAEQKLTERVGQGKGKIKLETAVKKMAEIEKPDQKVITAAGLVSFREVKRLKVTNEAIIPREYLKVDEVKLLEALKGGIEVKGAEIELIQIPANYRA